jgi:hypothetical protein
MLELGSILGLFWLKPGADTWDAAVLALADARQPPLPLRLVDWNNYVAGGRSGYQQRPDR